MSTSYKPTSYPSASPYLLVDEAQPVIDFLRESFDADVAREWREDDGSILHAEIRIYDSIIMISDSGSGFEAFPSWVHLYVPDVDAAYQRALDAGGTSAREPREQDGDPDRRAGVGDPAGNTWWLATQLPQNE